MARVSHWFKKVEGWVFSIHLPKVPPITTWVVNRVVKKGQFCLVIRVVKERQFWVVLSVIKKRQFWMVIKVWLK